MTKGPASRWRFQFTVRSLLVVTGLLALLLVPVAWVVRERQQMFRAQESMLRAREEALRAVVLAERTARLRAAANLEQSLVSDGADPPARTELKPAPREPAHATDSAPELIQRLQRENSELKDRVELLSREVERLKTGNRR
jgi:type II secretory pathway pseudopilin PulG